MTKSIALYCGKKEIDVRCNSIHPAFVDTPILNPMKQVFGNEEAIKKLAKTKEGKGFLKILARRAPGMLARRGAVAATGIGAIPALVSLIPELAYIAADVYAPETTKNPTNTTIQLFPGLDHDFIPTSDVCTGAATESEQSDELSPKNPVYSQEFQQHFQQWVLSHLGLGLI